MPRMTFRIQLVEGPRLFSFNCPRVNRNNVAGGSRSSWQWAIKQSNRKWNFNRGWLCFNPYGGAITEAKIISYYLVRFANEPRCDVSDECDPGCESPPMGGYESPDGCDDTHDHGTRSELNKLTKRKPPEFEMTRVCVGRKKEERSYCCTTHSALCSNTTEL